MTAIKTLFSTVLISLALLLSATASALEVGDQAPGFSLQATDGKTYSLEQFHNKHRRLGPYDVPAY